MKKLVCIFLTMIFALAYVQAFASSVIEVTPYSFDLSGYEITIQDIKAYEAKNIESGKEALVYVAYFSLGDYPISSYSNFFDSFSNVAFFIHFNDGAFNGPFDPILYTAWVDSRTATLAFVSDIDGIENISGFSLLTDYESSLPFAFVKAKGADKMMEINQQRTLYVATPIADEMQDLSDADPYLHHYIKVLCGYEGKNAN